MATKIILPHLGESVESAILAAWHKRVGDTVRRGEEIADVETDKATMPLEAPNGGTLLAIVVEAGREARIGELLAVIGSPGEVWDGEQAAPSHASPSQAQPVPQERAVAERAGKARLRVSPLAKRLAREMGVDLSMVTAGRSGVIHQEDVLAFASARVEPVAPPPVTTNPLDNAETPSRRIPLTSAQRTAARRMLVSAQTIPQFSVSIQADTHRLNAYRQYLATTGRKVSITALLIHLTCQALREHPTVNARYDDDNLIVYDTVNMNIAVASPDGLRAPVLRSAERLGLPEIHERLAALAERARQNRLTPADNAEGTISLSNLGMMGVAHFTPMINPPQAAILGIGASQPVLLPDGNGGMRLTEWLTLTATADHRVLDGAGVAAFLNTLRTHIEQID